MFYLCRIRRYSKYSLKLNEKNFNFDGSVIYQHRNYNNTLIFH